MSNQLELPIRQGIAKRDASAATHARELDVLVPVIQRLARSLGVVTLEDVRRDQSMLESKGRQLSYLGALPSRAGLVRVGMTRSKLPGSNGNWQAKWALPGVPL